jgi:hypothetical protein
MTRRSLRRGRLPHAVLNLGLVAGLSACLASVLNRPVAAETIFYQPLNRDGSLGPQQWQQIWKQARAHGFDRVIVQWSAYGDERFEQDDWLLTSLTEAHRQGLTLVIGLAADPTYFQTVLQPGWKDRFNDYWAALQRQSLAQQQRLLPRLSQRGLPVAGWYLPAELSDRLFAETTRRDAIRSQLQLLAARLDKPLHISAYSTGQLSPTANGAWLQQLQDAGLQVWWQDGEGIAELPALMRQTYLQALPCPVGIVREAFRQTSAAGAPFTAVPATPQPPVACHPNAVFALQYLPWAGALRPSPPTAGAGS